MEFLEDHFGVDDRIPENDFWLVQISDVEDDEEIKRQFKNVHLKYNARLYIFGHSARVGGIMFIVGVRYVTKSTVKSRFHVS